MRIAHLCLSNFYIDNQSFQENEIVRQHVVEGHEVLVLASTETYSEAGRIIYTEPGHYQGVEGAQVWRLPYRKFLPHRVMSKLRMNVGVYKALAQFAPDIILFHGTTGWELRTVARYVHDHPHVRFLVDSHENWSNSARTFISREILHRRYYGPVLRSVLDKVEKILCVSTASIDFVADIYRVPREELEFFPLGGRPIPTVEYDQRRLATRKALGVADDHIVIVQSGKQNRRKKLLETLTVFATCQNDRLRLFIIGVLQDDIRQEAEHLIAADPRVVYLGWQTTDELTDILCAADIYLQPGTQSVTMQHSLCCHCAIILDDIPSHTFYHVENGWLLNRSSPLEVVLKEIPSANLHAMQENSLAIACDKLDYVALSRRITTPMSGAPD
jgi:1,2-diacylglycerol 3-alpha-glucosyltransferase